MALPPLLQQYSAVRAAYPKFLLLFQVGDFYEMFYDDAVTASNTLQITLTRFGGNKLPGDAVPMCGFQRQAIRSYSARLVRAGFQLAICDQERGPKRGSNRLINRSVSRLITPGTLLEEDLLDPKASNYLLAIDYPLDSEIELSVDVAWTDISTGEFRRANVPNEDLVKFVENISPTEVLVPELGTDNLSTLVRTLCTRMRKLVVNEIPANSFAEGASGGISAYLEFTNGKRVDGGSSPHLEDFNQYMAIDMESRRSLELSHKDSRKASVLRLIDQTVTSHGARLLRSRLARPLLNVSRIDERLAAVEYFVRQPVFCNTIRKHLSPCGDLERCIQRVLVGAGSTSYDLPIILKTLQSLERLVPHMKHDSIQSSAILRCRENLLNPEFWDLAATMASCFYIAKDRSLVIKEDYCEKLSTLRTSLKELKAEMGRLPETIAGIVGVPVNKIKLGTNNISGMYLEVSKLAVPEQGWPEGFMLVKDMKTKYRYTYPDLIDLETRIAECQVEIDSSEKRILDELKQLIIGLVPSLSKLCGAMARLDVYTALARVSAENGYSKPNVNESCYLSIEGGRHPVVDNAVANSRCSAVSSYTTNDCSLDPNRGLLWFLTGPNMSGKSTFIRQVGLIAILAQMGCFVPASNAEIGIVDKLFCRVGGSADDITQNKSSFMMEMTETAHILNSATSKSLVLMDEVGRGTAARDGCAVAGAVLIHLHDRIQCRSIFASHFHELHHLKSRLQGMALRKLWVSNAHQGGLLFRHKVVPGVANASYGVEVAALAGLLPCIIQDAHALYQASNGSSHELEELSNSEKVVTMSP